MIANPLVSVIIPIYKVEPYLRACVDSVIAQTYENLEIILVDDGSPDNCPTICDEYAQKDNRIKVIHKKNGGLSDARNAGIEVATGEYLSFVDSDDICNTNMINILMRPIVADKNIELSCGNHETFFDNAVPNQCEEKIENTLILDPIDYLINKWTPSAWAKIYRTELFANVRYPVGRYHEDTFTTYKLQYKATKIAYIESKIYYYRLRNDSIMGSPNRKRVTDLHDASIECVIFFTNKEPQLYSKFLLVTAYYYYWTQVKGNVFYCNNCDDILQSWKKELLNFPLSKLTLADKLSYTYIVRFTKIKKFVRNLKKKLKV